MPRGSVSHWLKTTSTWAEKCPAIADIRSERVSTLSVPGQQCIFLQDHDVLIIGAGITGCSLALHLRRLQPHLKILLVEARAISEGATGRNGGLMWPSLNAPWPTTIAQYGESTARQLLDFEMHAFQDTLSFIQENHLEEELQFGLFPAGGITLCETQAELDIELADYKAQVAMGLEPLVQPLSAAQITKMIGPNAFLGGLKQDKVARVTAVRLAHALLREACKLSPPGTLTILEHHRVTALQHTKDGKIHAVVVPEPDGPHGGGPELRTCVAKVVHCTNGYNHLLPGLKTTGWLVPVRNQVAVTQPLPERHPMPHAAFYSRNGFVYWSRRHDNRVVIGGFRHVTPHLEWGTTDDSSQGLDTYVSEQLRLYLPDTFPHMFRYKPGYVGASVTAHNNTCQGVAKAGTNTRMSGRASNTVHGQLSVMPTHGNSGGAGRGSNVRDASGQVLDGAEVIHYELEWSGILGFTKDRWPLVGALPSDLAAAAGVAAGAVTGRISTGAPLEYCCMGFSGHGMTRAYTCAKNIALMVLGMPTEPGFLSTIFSPDRVLKDPIPTGAPALPTAAPGHVMAHMSNNKVAASKL